jgi:hydroxyacylglutathione hydrolase
MMTGDKQPETQRIVQYNLGNVNVFFIIGEKTVIVDAGPHNSSEKIMNKLMENGLTADDVSLIIITHAHADHYGGAYDLKNITGSPVAVHRSDSAYIKHGKNAPVKFIRETEQWVKEYFMKKARKMHAFPVEPDIIIENEMDMAGYGVNGKIIHTPGHSEGSCSIILDDGRAILGDLLISEYRHPEHPALPIYGDNLSDIFRSIRKIIALSPTVLYTSHGLFFNLDSVINFLKNSEIH